MAPSGVFEDTPAWEAGLRVHEAENKWLLRETLAVLSASKCYAKSLSGAPTAFDLGVDSLGGVLGALSSAGAGAALAVGMEGMGFDGDAGGHHASAEANFAAALERVGHHGVSADDEEMAAPMAAAIGAPLLTPIADTLRAVGMLRESLGRRVHRALVGNLQAFVDEDVGSVATMRERYEAEKAACDAARAAHLAQSSSSTAPGASRARASAARNLAAAKESLDVARARLSLAQIALEGRRRYVLLEAARQTTVELRRFFAEASSAMAGIDRELRDMEEYEMASRAQAEMKMESAARHMQRAFDGLADDEAATGGADERGDDGDEARDASRASASSTNASSSAATPHAGRSADASIRRTLASGVEALGARGGDCAGPLGVGTIRKGYLSERSPGTFGGWTRRYFVLDGAGRFFVHGRKGNPKAARASSNARAAGTGPEDAGREKPASRAASALRGIGAAFAGVARAAAPEPEPAPGAGLGVRVPVDFTLTDAEIASDLTVSCVKPGPDPRDGRAADRPFCFRVIAPTGARTLQAESEAEARAWVEDLQGVIAELIVMGPIETRPGASGGDRAKRATGERPKGDDERRTKKGEKGDLGTRDSVRAALASAPGNGQCADCGAPDPDWASLNLVVVVCQRCAGAHRHLGARVSKVRSVALDLDAWTPPVLSLFSSVGNERANDFWEARRRDGTVAPKVLRLEAAIKEGKDERGLSGKEPEHPPPVAFAHAGDPDATLAAVTRKYVARDFVKPATAATRTCAAAAEALDVPALLERLVRSSVDARDAERVARDKREGLLAAVARGEDAAPVAALLLLHGARVDGDGDEGEGEGGGGSNGDGEDEGGGGGGGGDTRHVQPTRLRLDVARRAREAGCPLDGSVFALLRAAAETQGAAF